MGGGQRYANGRIPDAVLITFGSGYSAGEGNWTHRLSAGTYAKHKDLVQRAKQRTGKTLQITAGNNAYRDFEAQVYARKMHGRGAAVPGTSSHGGWWEGQNTLAIDYHNWSYVYGGNREAFYEDVRAVGLSPGLISVPRGYPDEPWHVVDLDPWRAVPSGGGSTPIEKILEDAMSNPIVNVVNKYGDAQDTGTLWIGVSDGSFERYVAPYDPNIRGVAGAVFYGGAANPPTVNQRDFQTVQRLWKTMQSRK